MTKTDMQLKQDVERELQRAPKVNASKIGVAVSHGAVSLLGNVDSLAGMWAAENAAKRVLGVRVVANALAVTALGLHAHDDAEIAEATLAALQGDVRIPKTVTATIQAGRITLAGRVDVYAQREYAAQAVRYLEGVTGVVNAIKVNATVSIEQVNEKVQAVLQRQVPEDRDSRIHVSTSGSVVTLSGTASSWQVIEDAMAAAWAAPGVSEVVQDLRPLS